MQYPSNIWHITTITYQLLTILILIEDDRLITAKIEYIMNTYVLCGEEQWLFCPNGPIGKIPGEIIHDIIYIDNRISKAKLVGVLFFAITVFSNIIFNVPSALRAGFHMFFIVMLAAFISGLFYYAICRGGGFLIRNILIKKSS